LTGTISIPRFTKEIGNSLHRKLIPNIIISLHSADVIETSLATTLSRIRTTSW